MQFGEQGFKSMVKKDMIDIGCIVRNSLSYNGINDVVISYSNGGSLWGQHLIIQCYDYDKKTISKIRQYAQQLAKQARQSYKEVNRPTEINIKHIPYHRKDDIYSQCNKVGMIISSSDNIDKIASVVQGWLRW